MRRDERGFTLVEVLVTTAVLGVGIVGFLQATLLAERLRLRGRALSEAAQLAEAGLERVAALGWERATADLAAESHPALTGSAAPLPALRVGSRGLEYLVLYPPAEPGPAPPRFAVHCFWARAASGFRPADSVVLRTRLR